MNPSISSSQHLFLLELHLVNLFFLIIIIYRPILAKVDEAID